MTACCKTHYLLSMLENEYMKHFETTIVLCPTFGWNRAYQEWKYKNDADFITMPCDQDDIELLLKYVVGIFKGTNSLIILDDCASSHEIKNRTIEVVKLGCSARHYALSTIIITQQLISVTKPYRENISKHVTFYTNNRNDKKAITDDYLNVSGD